MSYEGMRGSVVIVTGAAQGIGAGVAERLVATGAVAVLIDRAQEPLEAFARTLRPKAAASGGEVETHPVDVTDRDAVSRMVEGVVERRGRIDGLVNCAGVLHLQGVLDHDADAFENVLRVNVLGTFLVTQAVARAMVQRQRGSVVTIASIAGHQPRFRQAAYCASKSAVAQLMRCFSVELSGSGLRFNCVSPGPTDTPMVRGVIEKSGGPEKILRGVPEEFRAGIPLGRIADVDDIARSVLFLLSDDAKHVTMQDLVVDGGHTLGA
jgi:2,3-dihydro-2,3-dihydroxybenzoate dehydrogenase